MYQFLSDNVAQVKERMANPEVKRVTGRDVRSSADTRSIGTRSGDGSGKRSARSSFRNKLALWGRSAFSGAQLSPLRVFAVTVAMSLGSSWTTMGPLTTTLYDDFRVEFEFSLLNRADAS